MDRFLVKFALDIPNTQPRYHIQVDRVVSIAAQKPRAEFDLNFSEVTYFLCAVSKVRYDQYDYTDA